MEPAARDGCLPSGREAGDPKAAVSTGARCALCSSGAHVCCHADEALLCCACDQMVHTANFLVSRHVRVLLCAACGGATRFHMWGPGLLSQRPLCETCQGRAGGAARRSNAAAGQLTAAGVATARWPPSECPKWAVGELSVDGYGGEKASHSEVASRSEVEDGGASDEEGEASSTRPVPQGLEESVSPAAASAAPPQGAGRKRPFREVQQTCSRKKFQGGGVPHSPVESIITALVLKGVSPVGDIRPHRGPRLHTAAQCEGRAAPSSDDESDVRSSNSSGCARSSIHAGGSPRSTDRNGGGGGGGSKCDNGGLAPGAAATRLRIFRVLARWHLRLAIGAREVVLLAFLLFRRAYQGSRLQRLSAEKLRGTLAACLWVASKLGVMQAAVPTAASIAAVARIPADQLLTAELQLLSLLEWRPLEGLVLDWNQVLS